MRLTLLQAILLTAALPTLALAQTPTAASTQDSDRDGISDMQEQELLVQFAPRFTVGRHDCSDVPAEFQPGQSVPQVRQQNGTIYGQVFPARTSTAARPAAEIHFYHLWKSDCGAHGHPLDTEHVAALVHQDSHDGQLRWTADYWYAAAHEDTVCNVSQITRAKTLHAEQQGPQVWISPGKHASYLNPELCHAGCGADQCTDMIELPRTPPINLGEIDAPMNGSVFTSSPAWPLRGKMEQSNFPPAVLARLDALPASDIAWFDAGRHPAQGIVRHSYTTERALAGSEHTTGVALSVAGDSAGSALNSATDNTGSALGNAANDTGNALGKSYSKTAHALGRSARAVKQALTPKPRQQ